MLNFLKNYLGTMFFIWFGYVFYTSNSYYLDFFSGTLSSEIINFQTNIPSIFIIIIIMYAVLLMPFYIMYKKKSKGRILINYLLRAATWDIWYSKEEQTAFLAWIVKIFFAPLMIMWLSEHIFTMTNNIYFTLQNTALISTDFLLFFNQNFFWMAFSLILFTDVFFFTMGYLFEAPFLKNTIRSVEPTILGWGVALICYPPFNSQLSNLIGWYSSDFPTFENIYIHIIMNVCILVLMWIYSWASLSLWFKASNLTNRWIVSKWPYKYVRHPAYICKNTAWIIGALPMMIIALSNTGTNILYWVLWWSLWVFGWATIYYMRAMTEEIHLSADPDYVAYKKQVQWKFIPKVW